MNKQELEERLNEIGSKIDQTITLWSVGCPPCISFNEGSNGLVVYSYLTQGLMDGKDIEYKTREEAQAAVNSHNASHALHQAYVSSTPITEYLTHTDRHMIRYRVKYSPDYIRVHSVNDYKIASYKCAYECKFCNAIYQSKGYPNHSFFATDDPRCQEEKQEHIHPESRCGLRQVNKLCLCYTIEHEAELNEERQKKKLLNDGKHILTNAVIAISPSLHKAGFMKLSILLRL